MIVIQVILVTLGCSLVYPFRSHHIYLPATVRLLLLRVRIISVNSVRGMTLVHAGV